MAHTLPIFHYEGKQAVRMRRYFMAAGTSLMVIGLLFICYLQGILEQRAFIEIAAVIVFFIAAFFVLFRSGLNRKFSDPSLTLPQMAASSLTILYAMYAADRARDVFAIILVMIFLFGVLRFGRWALLLYTASLLGGYLAVIGLLWRFKPETVDISLEITQWIVMALTLPWFALMGGYVSELRAKLRRSNTEMRSALEIVQTSEANLAETQRLARLGCWSCDPARGTAAWSTETYRIFGCDSNKPAATGEAFWQLVHEEDRSAYRELVEGAYRNGWGFESEFRIQLPNGDIRWLHAIGRPDIDERGQITALRGTLMEITDRKEAEEALKRSEARFRSLTALSADWYWEQDDQLRFTEIAGSPFESTGIAMEQFLGEPWLEVIGNGLPSETVEAHREVLRLRAPFQGLVYTLVDAKGDTRYLKASGEPLFDPAERFIGYRGVTKDITPQRAAEERIRQLAHYDDLTGLPNRPLFHELITDRLAKASRQKNQVAILFIDLDGFKQVNDTLGHDAGDQLLRAFAQRLRSALRRSDVVARFGGDEFVVSVDDFVASSQLAVVARKILDIAVAPFLIAGTSCNVSASVGIAVYPTDGYDNDSLLKSADSAMYQAKQAGKSCYRFYSVSHELA